MPGEEGPGGDVVGDTGRTPDFHCFSRSPFCASGRSVGRRRGQAARRGGATGTVRYLFRLGQEDDCDAVARWRGGSRPDRG
jgi:hypothetical protein